MGILDERHEKIKSERRLTTNAYKELMEALLPNEKVEKIVFGSEPTFFSKGRYPVPEDKAGKAMSLQEAEPYMKDWKFDALHKNCYATYIWTDQRVFFVSNYDGSMQLEWVPRNPTDIEPDMIGSM